MRGGWLVVLGLVSCSATTVWAQQSALPVIPGSAISDPSGNVPSALTPSSGAPGRPAIVNQQGTAREPLVGAKPWSQTTTSPPELESNEFQEFVAVSAARWLPMFGYDLFTESPSTFAPVDRVPVTADYMIGPGDELVIRGWGQVDIDYRVFVDRNGAIYIPQIGSLTVGGLRYQDLQGFLRSAISRVFRNFELSVSLGQLRSIQIFIVGNARRPGAYTVSSLSTLVNALFASGGPSTKGSMRAIQLKRGDAVITQFDVYDLLLKGDKSKDVRLLPGDVIYIPPIGELVAVSGSVNQPAIFETKPGSTIADLVQLAGGLSTVAAGQKARIERILERRTRQVDEFELDKSGLSRTVRNGDLVHVFPLSPQFENAVTVRGPVANPGRFPWREGMKVRDLLPNRDALISRDYWLRLNQLGRIPDTPERRAIEQKLLAQKLADRRMMDRRSTADTQSNDPRFDDAQSNDPRSNDPRVIDGRGNGVRGGEVRSQQRLGDFRSQQRLADTGADETRERGDMKRVFDEINWDYAVIERLDPIDLTTTLVPFNLSRAVLDADPAQNLPLRPGDVVTVFSRVDIQVPVAKQTQFVRLEGEVRTPGVYQLLPGETLRQLVSRVGGFTPSAYLYASELTRESVRAQQQKRLDEAIERLAQEIERTAAGRAQTGVDEKESVQAQADSQRRLIARLRDVRATGRIVLEVQPDRTDVRELPEIVLEDGDRLFVPPRPSTVGVIGSVYNQTAFVYGRDKRVADYLQLAGGPTRGADEGRTYVVRADGSVTGRASSSVFNPFSSEKVNPGDTIVVPENLERFYLTKQVRDWTQIFYQFALGVAGLKVLRDF
jgi:polysaccharide export outer membrane protein